MYMLHEEAASSAVKGGVWLGHDVNLPASLPVPFIDLVSDANAEDAAGSTDRSVANCLNQCADSRCFPGLLRHTRVPRLAFLFRAASFTKSPADHGPGVNGYCVAVQLRGVPSHLQRGDVSGLGER